ncbi:hypothetical protein DPMN_006467 [Dreissena polymorpha]|uniref:Uncharacterized protein n=1 Tax=Dreissena polymorpha TaxID=45954 RepID=A0A9D4RUY7_DREPO|nr:hypothetical protein DPMN_137769 [Dreissena polymorpha]KAH3882526.1 hypothetical protein DPMN_006467 [Dreissena polymorpha]
MIFLCFLCFCFVFSVSEFYKPQDSPQTGTKPTGTKSTVTQKNKTSPFQIKREDFSEIFAETVPEAINSVGDNKFHKLSFSVQGKGIIKVSEKLKTNSEVVKQLTEFLCEPFHKIFNTTSKEMNHREAIFAAFYEMRIDSVDRVSEIVNKIVDCDTLPVRQFAATLLHQVLEDLISKRSSMYTRSEKEAPQLSHDEQAVLFFISGYLIRALSKQVKRVKVSEKESLVVAIGNMEKNNESTSITKQYSKWTEKLNRGGLKIPNEDTFLLVREFENQCRKTVDENLSCSDIHTVELKEQIMDAFMVQYYAEKLMPGKYSMIILEKMLSVFLTMRGHATARKKKSKLLQTTKTKALRTVLKEKSNVK